MWRIKMNNKEKLVRLIGNARADEVGNKLNDYMEWNYIYRIVDKILKNYEIKEK
jgi:hypothetical protein